MNERFSIGLTLLVPGIILGVIDLRAALGVAAFLAGFLGVVPGGVLMWAGRRAEVASGKEQLWALFAFALLLFVHMVAALPLIGLAYDLN